MEKPMKVMLAEEGSEYGQTCANVLRSYGYEVTLVPKDGSEVISRLPIHTPDVLLMDMFMPHVDALGVMKALPELKLSKRPLICYVECGVMFGLSRKFGSRSRLLFS